MAKPHNAPTPAPAPAPTTTAAPAPAASDWDDTAPATAAPVSKPALAFKIKRNVTFTLLKKTDGVPVYIRAESTVYTGKVVEGKPGKESMAPARIMQVINLETGEAQEMIVNKVLESAFTENYPDGSYVGKCFEIIQSNIPGKRYKGYKLTEIEVS